MINGYGKIKLLTGTTHPVLAERVAKNLDIELVNTTIEKFANGELYACVNENVRGQDVFYLSSLHTQSSSNAILETQLLIDCIRSSAGRITGVFPWLCFSKQDRRTKPRETRSLLVIAKTLSNCGLDRVILFDLHNKATADFFDIPNDHVYLMRLLIEEFDRRNPQNAVIVSPDIGSGKRASAVAQLTGRTDIAIVWKIHDPKTKKLDLSKTRILGDVKNKEAWIFDDMIQSFGTLEAAIEILHKAGAKKIIIAAVHPDFTPELPGKESAIRRIAKSKADEVIVVNTIPHKHFAEWPTKITTLDAAPFIADCINFLHEDKPLSPLFLQF
ncbi:MAG: ribose-phosphate pyrophosphokinase [Patescibacteria group bacterium]|nr:ribose-phosphate pyrophosphokinase [Patescibacteria group bacterium]